jgi:hypothetical protein
MKEIMGLYLWCEPGGPQETLYPLSSTKEMGGILYFATPILYLIEQEIGPYGCSSKYTVAYHQNTGSTSFTLFSLRGILS